MSKKLIAVDAPEKYLSITWQVNNFCNYSCSYCNPGNWIGDQRNEEDSQLYINNLREIVQRYQQEGYKNYKFFFSGGEPTAWRNFMPILEWIRSELPGATIAVNTNLSRPLGWWKKHYHFFDDIIASFHVEQCEKDKYLEKTQFLCDKIPYLSSKILLHDERFWECVQFGERLKQELPNYFIEWTPLYDEITHNTGPWQYADPDKEAFIQEHNIEQDYTVDKPWNTNNTASYSVYEDGSRENCVSNDIIVNRQNFFTGWQCDVGDCVFISPIGRISLASCGITGEIGHILNDISEVRPLTMTCNREHCMCGTDIIIPKRYDEEVIAVGTD